MRNNLAKTLSLSYSPFNQSRFSTLAVMAEMGPTLESFEISRITGFLPEVSTPSQLPECFREWNEAASKLSDLLRSRNLRTAVHSFPEFRCENLTNIAEWRSALVLLSGIFQGYMWQEGEKGVPDKMPSVLCVPFHTICEKIGVPLVGTYASTVLYNWSLRDREKAMTTENLQAIVNHTGTDDESWFFMVHVAIEVKAVPAIEAIWNGLSAMEEKSKQRLIQSLKIIESALNEMEHVLETMDANCDPKTFYVYIRPFLAGTKGLDAFPNGMIYEGVYEDMPQKYNGGSAAQSTPIRAVSLFLGVEHQDSDAEFVESMKMYMPRKHRNFLDHISKYPSARQYILENCDEDLLKQYNLTIEALTLFRKKHIEIVTRFIVTPSNKYTEENKSL